MCGIVGYIGPQEATPIIFEGLRKLEYRGYDSAGIATLQPDGIAVRRSEGKLINLAKLLQEQPLTGTIGIGHTRWATHGRPSETNAHPHKAGPIVVVHNGIIENYLSLREQLKAAGHTFSSETDTEVIAHLVEEKHKQGAPFESAVRTALQELQGAFAVCVLCLDEPGTLIAPRSARRWWWVLATTSFSLPPISLPSWHTPAKWSSWKMVIWPSSAMALPVFQPSLVKRWRSSRAISIGRR